MKKIAFIAALESEVVHVREAIQNIKEEKIACSVFYSGVIGNCEVVLVKCGWGLVNAALCTQILIDVYKPDYIINTGCAGAFADDLKVGDVVISECTAQWDLDTTALGDPRGFVPPLNRVKSYADPELASKIEQCIPKDRDINIRKGLIVTGNQFVCKEEQRQIIAEDFADALCVEMEGSAVACVCDQNNVPFCIVRCMSDTADGNSQVDYPKFAEKTGREAAKVLVKFCTEYK